MRSVTEFANFTLNQGIKAKEGLAAEGKSAEEIQTSLGATFKLEGDKLKYFVNALEVASTNLDGLKRIRVVALAEGENAPPGKSQKIEDMTYLIEPHVVARAPQPEGDGKDGKGKGRGGKGRGGPGRGGPRGPGGPGGDRGAKGDKAKTDKPN